MRRVKLRITHEKLEDLHPADLAEIMEDLSAAERQGIIASLDEETAAAVLAELDERLTTQIVEKMDPERAADILEEMAPDAAADLLADLSKEVSEELLDEMPGQEADEVRELLEFDPKTAGGMMNTDFAFVGESIDPRGSAGVDARAGIEFRPAGHHRSAGRCGAIFGNGAGGAAASGCGGSTHDGTEDRTAAQRAGKCG